MDDPVISSCVVLGGRGFVGRSLVLALLKFGNWTIRIADSVQARHLDPPEHNTLLFEAISTRRVSYVQVDVRKRSQVLDAIRGSSVVFFTDAVSCLSDNFCASHTFVVQGAKNVITACRACKVKRLIYHSSSDVVLDGYHDIHDGDESLPYPFKFEDPLWDLMRQAEALILQANDIGNLLTCAIRPSNTFGAEDSLLVPLMKCGWAKFVVGSGGNMSDFTYVENVAFALVLAEEALRSKIVSGKAFFVTNLEPVNFWDIVIRLFDALGYERPMIKLPASIIWSMSCPLNWVIRKLFHSSPRSHHSIHYALQLSLRARTYNCSAAQQYLKYQPIVALEDGIRSMAGSISHLVNDSLCGRERVINEETTVTKFLGSGNVADVLLWRDERKSFSCFLTLVLFYYGFFLSGRTLISSAARLILLFTVFLSVHSFLPSNMFKMNVEKLSLSYFELSEMSIANFIVVLAHLWNIGFHHINFLAEGQDWSALFKVVISLCAVRVVVSYSLAAVAGASLIVALTAFFIYEQCEEEIYNLVSSFLRHIECLLGHFLKCSPSSIFRANSR